jgi:hypothetical protein
MPSTAMLRRVSLVRIGVSEKHIASNIRVRIIGELGTTLAVTSKRSTMRSNTMSVLTRPTWVNIQEDGILHSHRHESLKSYIALTSWAMKRRGNVFPVRNELRFYIPEDHILHSHRRENLKSYIDSCYL